MIRLSALPRPWRLGLFGLATAVILVLCLLPDSALPKIPLWDKIEHSLAWGALTAVGVVLSPRRWRAIAIFAVLLGVAVEVTQAITPYGRQGDWRDFAADSVGVLIALRILQAKRRWDLRRANPE